MRLPRLPFDKLRLSRHQERNIETGREGHDYSLEDASSVIRDPIEMDIDPRNGRLRLWGIVRNQVVRVVTSATVSDFIYRVTVVSTHRHRRPKK